MNRTGTLCVVNLVGLHPPTNGGASRVARSTCKLLIGLSKSYGFKLVFAVGWNFAAHFSSWIDEQDVCVIPCLHERGATPFIRSLNPDVIISPLFGMHPFQEYNSAAGIPHIVFMPDTLALDKPEYFKSCDLSYRNDVYSALLDASHVVTLSDSARKGLIDKAGLDPAKLLVSYLCIDEPLDDDQEMVNPDQFKPYLFYPANDWPHKRHRLLQPIMNEIWQTRPELNLLLTGHHSKDFSNLNGFSDAPQTQEGRVVDLGYVSEASIRKLYKNAEALLFASEYEGFGIPLLEALHHGCPVITSSTTSIPEVVGQAAIMVNSEDPKEWAQSVIHSLPRQRDRLIEDGKHRALQFTRDKMNEPWMQAFGEVGLLSIKNSRQEQTTYIEDIISEELQAWSTLFCQQDECLQRQNAQLEILTKPASTDIQVKQPAATEMGSTEEMGGETSSETDGQPPGQPRSRTKLIDLLKHFARSNLAPGSRAAWRKVISVVPDPWRNKHR